MLAFGGTIAIRALFFTGPWTHLIVLLSTYKELAYQGGISNETQANGTILASPTTFAEAFSTTVAPTAGVTYAPVGETPAKDAVYLGRYSKRDCRKMVMSLSKRLIKLLNKCGRAFKRQYSDQDEYNKRFQCVVRCMMEEAGALDEYAKFTNATVDTFIKTQLPPKYHDLAWHLGFPCLEKIGYYVDPEDEYCTLYGDFLKCLQNIVSDC